MRLCVLCLALWGIPAGAADTIDTVLVPFTYAHEKGQALSDALELELELSETLLLTPPDGVLDALDVPLAKADAASRMRAMKSQQVKAMIRAQAVPKTDYIAISVIRGKDGEVVFGLQVNVDDALKDPETLALELTAAIEDIKGLPALSENAQAALLEPPEATQIAAGQPTDTAEAGAPDEAELDAPPAEATDRAGETPAAEPGRQDAPKDEGDAPPPSAEDEAKEEEVGLFDRNAAEDRLVRFTLGYAPGITSYRACQPGGDLPAFAMLCGPEGDDPKPSTLARYPLVVGAAGTLEIYPWIPFIGLSIDGAFGLAPQIPIAFTKENGDPLFSVENGGALSESSTLYAYQGRVLASVVGRYFQQFGFFAFTAGAKVGALTQFQFAPRHLIDDEGVTRQVTLLPWFTNAGLAVGGQLSFGFGRWVRLLLEGDVVPGASTVGLGMHCEGPTWVSNGPIADAPQCALFGAVRGKAQVDVDVSYGVLLSARLEGVALSSIAEGTGTRQRLDLQPFDSGAVEWITGQASLGVGYRF